MFIMNYRNWTRKMCNNLENSINKRSVYLEKNNEQPISSNISAAKPKLFLSQVLYWHVKTKHP